MYNALKYKSRLILRSNAIRGLYHHVRRKYLNKSETITLPSDIIAPPWNLFKHKAEVIDYYQQHLEIKDEIFHQANLFVQGKVIIFNEVVNLYDYSIENYELHDYDNSLKNTDLRFVWEIYRGKFLFNVCLAYFLSGDEQYAKSIFTYIKDWRLFSPLQSDTIPYNGMECAIKAMNMSWTLYFLEARLNDNIHIKNKLIESIISHVDYSYRNYDITIYGLESNHGLTCSVGLIFTSILFENNPRISKWKTFGRKCLLRGLKNQFSLDGVNFESSTHYHRFTYELLLFLFAALLKKNRELSDIIKPYVMKIASSTMGLTHSNRMISRFGDNDGGLFLPGTESVHEFSDMSYLYSFLEPDIIGNNRSLMFIGIEDMKELHIDSERVRYGNYFSVKLPLISLICSANDIGTQGKGNHQHNDFSAFELYGQEPFIVDAWSYCYTGNSNQRNKDRSTRSHNSVVIDNREIIEYSDDDLFEFRGNISIQSSIIKNDDQICSFMVSHNGYKDLNAGRQKTTRIISVNRMMNTVEICDHLEGKGKHSAEINYIIPKSLWKLSAVDDELIFQNKSEKFVISHDWDIVTISETNISPRFMRVENAYRIVFEASYTRQAILTTKLTYFSC
jgi:hypothetical protein